MSKPPLVVIAGPTAVGKTALAIALAQKLNAEIISADSMQVYRYMDIGTAKPSPAERQGIKHHLIDLVTPDCDFSVSDYQNYFHPALASILAAGKLPIFSGGTGLYIRACLESFLTDNPAGADPEFRRVLHERAERDGSAALHQELQRIDPSAAGRIHPNDLRRVIRALEVYHSTGRPFSELQSRQPGETKYQVIYIFLDRDRTELYQRIDERVEQMFKQGLVAEVRMLMDRGYGPDLKPMQSLGYRQICSFLHGSCTLDQAIAEMKSRTRNYAKRQLTWFRREPVDFWVNLSEKQSNNGFPREIFLEILEYLEGRLERM
ncbi:MAG TPA: tRNA (adenosine(37)-N6)-dimethylallyltransferase MiaA [Bacillota bacterium]